MSVTMYYWKFIKKKTNTRCYRSLVIKKKKKKMENMRAAYEREAWKVSR